MENGKALATRDAGAMLEQVVVKGDLRDLTEGQRVSYYNEVCKSIGVNPLTQPFAYITLNGKLTLYATRACTDQLRKVHKITSQVVSRERIDDVYVVTARVSTPDGRSDESIGAVAIGTVKGEALANALMKAETKAKRRATLSLVGLGWLDETEVETIPGARLEAPPVEAKVVEPPARPAPQPRKPGPVSPLYCADCREPIKSVALTDGSVLSPEEIAERTHTTFKRQLCLTCADKAAKTSKPAQEPIF